MGRRIIGNVTKQALGDRQIAGIEMRCGDLVGAILLKNLRALRRGGGWDGPRARAIAEHLILGAHPVQHVDAIDSKLLDARGQGVRRRLKGICRAIHVLMVIKHAIAGLQCFEHIDRRGWSCSSDLRSHVRPGLDGSAGIGVPQVGLWIEPFIPQGQQRRLLLLIKTHADEVAIGHVEVGLRVRRLQNAQLPLSITRQRQIRVQGIGENGLLEKRPATACRPAAEQSRHHADGEHPFQGYYGHRPTSSRILVMASSRHACG